MYKLKSLLYQKENNEQYVTPTHKISEGVTKIHVVDKKNKPGQTNWTTGFKFKLDVANTSLYTKFELFSSMCPHIGGLVFFTQIFFPFCLIFYSCPVQVNGENFQVQNFVFFTSKLKSTSNLRLGNISFSIFWQTFYFHTFGHKM